MEYTQITLDEWQQWKEDIRQKLQEAAGNFVYIGYRLRQIRDSGMFDGTADIFEFAMKEYGLGKSTVSRFIAINEKFSEGGNSLGLREEFKNIGSSKLSEMLTLPDAECQLITDRTTIKEIRDLKQFDRQQGTEQDGYTSYTPLERCIIDYFKDKREMLNDLMEAIYTAGQDEEMKKAAELINPSGYATHKKGLVFLFMYDWNTGVKYKMFTEPQPVCMSWREFLMNIYTIYTDCFENEEETWVAFYGEPAEEQTPVMEEKDTEENIAEIQENTAVATSQQTEDIVQMGTASLKEIIEGIPAPTEEEIKEAEEKMNAPEAAVEEYQTPNPVSVTSICYSCTEYEDCDAKMSTCTYCDQYKNREEAYKTVEQRYSEEQDRIDKETAKKLQNMADEEKMWYLPSDAENNVERGHQIKIGSSFFEDVCSGKKNFELRKNDRDYREGDILEMMEFEYGKVTGNAVKALVTYLLEDYTGLEEGYCIMGIKVIARIGLDLSGEGEETDE